jgi:hypothetical protein
MRIGDIFRQYHDDWIVADITAADSTDSQANASVCGIIADESQLCEATSSPIRNLHQPQLRLHSFGTVFPSAPTLVRESALTACRSASWRFVSSTTDILILIKLVNAFLQVRDNYDHCFRSRLSPACSMN